MTKHTLDVLARPNIPKLVEVKDSRVVVLEGSDAARIEEQQTTTHHESQPISGAVLLGGNVALMCLWASEWSRPHGAKLPMQLWISSVVLGNHSWRSCMKNARNVNSNQV